MPRKYSPLLRWLRYRKDYWIDRLEKYPTRKSALQVYTHSISGRLRLLSKRIHNINTQLARARMVFAGTTEERTEFTTSRLGTCFYDTDLDRLFVWSDFGWIPADGLMSGAIEDMNDFHNDGNIWYETDNDVGYIGVAGKYALPNINPQSPYFSLNNYIAFWSMGLAGSGIMRDYLGIYDLTNEASDPVYENRIGYISLSGFSTELLYRDNLAPIIDCAYYPDFIPGVTFVAYLRKGNKNQTNKQIMVARNKYGVYTLKDGIGLYVDGNRYYLAMTRDGQYVSRVYSDTMSENKIKQWNYIAGIYDPRGGLSLCVNSNWTRDIGNLGHPWPCYGGGNATIFEIGGGFDGDISNVAYCIGYYPPSEEQIEHIYYRTNPYYYNSTFYES